MKLASEKEERQKQQYILAIDQGTTSSRVVLVDKEANFVALRHMEISQNYPQEAWVEEDGTEIWLSVKSLMLQIMSDMELSFQSIAAIGITNQRESVVAWDKQSGEPIVPVVVWQCRRSADICEQLKEQGLEEKIRSKTGLPLDAYFSASKIKWLLDNNAEVREKAERKELLVGTIDSWLIWKLSLGSQHITDVTNASRTMLMNLESLAWDEDLLGIFGIPRHILPKIVKSSGQLAYFDSRSLERKGLATLVPITGIAGDQQAALFGQACFTKAMAKCTYGTGCFLLTNIGKKIIHSKHELITTLAWDIGEGAIYALEGSVFNAGSAVQWLRDELGIISKSSDCDILATKAKEHSSVYFVPSFTGLAAPYWDMQARGMLCGLTRDSGKAEICQAVLEGIAYRTTELCRAMEKDLATTIKELRVDGGVANSDILLKLQADLLGVSVMKPHNTETTVLGAALLAGLAVGFWRNLSEISELYNLKQMYMPKHDEGWRAKKLAKWQGIVEASRQISAL